MTDPRSPDDLGSGDLDGLDRLGLDRLTDGVTPTRAQWLAIDSAATSRKRRRTGILSAAAALFLVVGVASVLLTRQDTVDIATGSAVPGVIDDLPVHLTPTHPAEILSVIVQEEGATIGYRAEDTEYVLTQFSSDRPDSGGPRTQEELGASAAADGLVEVDGGPQGLVWVGCVELTPGVEPSAEVADRGTSTTATWMGDGVVYQLAALPPSTGSCDAAIPAMGSAVSALRQRTPEEWALFLAEHSAGTVPPSPLATTVPTVAEDPPADRGAAEEQISAAVAGLRMEDPDGTFPNLEDGVARADAYREMFAVAAEQAGSSTLVDAPETVFAVTSIRFVSPEEARIAYDSTATLPSGTFTFGNTGRAVLHDGRWVVSYDTITTMLGRACTPPGGASPSCSQGNQSIVAVPAD